MFSISHQVFGDDKLPLLPPPSPFGSPPPAGGLMLLKISITCGFINHPGSK